MRVACYYPWLYLRSGAERTILEVALRSRHQWTIWTNHFAPAATYPEFRSLLVRELSHISVKRSYIDAARAAAAILCQKLPSNEYDVLVVHSEGLGDLVTFRNHEKPVVCYCHTPLKVIHDPYARAAYVERNPTKAPLLALFGTAFTLVDRLAWKNYSYVFANSATVRERILGAGLASKEQVEVLPPGVDWASIAPGNHFNSFFLALTRIKWWKNVELAIEAFKSFRELAPDLRRFKLVVAGQVDEGSRGYFRELQDRARSCGAIEFVANPPVEKVRELYSSSYAVLNTTLNEDWGIVPIEANAFGKPVIAVNRGGPAESQINGVTGLLVDATPQAFADAMVALASDEGLARRMGQAGRLNAEKYDWRFHVERLDAVLSSIGA
jgi:glycosyltransferase involved in cell wall biosynthesis